MFIWYGLYLFLFLSTFLWIHLILASFNLLVNPLLVLYFRFRWCGNVVLKYSSIMLFVFGFVLFFMNCVNVVKLFLMRFVLLTIQSGRSWMLLFKCDNRLLASDRFFTLDMFDIFSKYLFKHGIQWKRHNTRNNIQQHNQLHQSKSTHQNRTTNSNRKLTNNNNSINNKHEQPRNHNHPTSNQRTRNLQNQR